MWEGMGALGVRVRPFSDRWIHADASGSCRFCLHVVDYCNEPSVGLSFYSD